MNFYIFSLGTYRQAALLPPSTPPTSARPALLLENVKVLNLAGSSWDNVLLATGATAIQNNAPLLQSLTSLHNRGGGAGGSAGGRSRTKHGGGGGRPAHVDLILVDPHEYALSLKESTQVAPAPTSGRYTTPNSLLLSTHTAAGAAGAGAGSSASKIPNSALKIGVAELQAIQKCVEARGGGVNYSGGSVPIVVTTDWLVHCLAVGRLLDYTIVDFFTLPSDPVKRPFTHKMDSVQGTGERYSKYDVVYYTNQRAKSPRISEALSMGRIDSFVRRDEKSPLMVRIRPLVLSTSFQLGPKDTFGGVDPGDGYGHRELTGDPHNAMCLVEVDRLAGKLVLLHKEDFLRVEQYSASDDCVYYASEDWLVENPNVLEVAGAKDDASGAGSEGESEPQMHVQRSQDY